MDLNINITVSLSEATLNVLRQFSPDMPEHICRQSYDSDEFQKADPLDLSKEWMQDAVDRFHHPDRKERRDLFQMFAEFRTAKDVSPARMKRYDVTIRALDRFQQYRGRPLTIEGITAETLEEFRSFLQDEHRLAELKKYHYIYIGRWTRPRRSGAGTPWSNT